VVPQELVFDPFFKVVDMLRIQAGYYGCGREVWPWIDEMLERLDLAGKRTESMRSLSGGMKRRVLIAKALSHDPEILFLDEPTAGVDVELRREMWALVRGLRDRGTTVVLTTHYIDEAEEMADRIGVIDKGALVVVDEKAALMRSLGTKQLTVHLARPLAAIPESLSDLKLALNDDATELELTYDAHKERTDVPSLLRRLGELGIEYRDIETRQTSLEEIFVKLVSARQ
jgi:ABC-2 type transport system ATP-binding protein